MTPRIDFYATAFGADFMKRFNAVGPVLARSTLPASLQELVKIRASQINGCGFCTDMHTKDAAAAGETTQRLNLIAAWRDATVFTPAERAALALTEEGSRLADAATGVTDAVWEEARAHFDDEQLAALIAVVGVINAYNRFSVISGRPGGSYEPGMFG